MNIYTGNVTTDELDLATITLPSWFEALNTDFRYQLTVIGQFAQAIIKNKIADGKFTIMTNQSHVEVSWQVTAVRQDAYAQAHPLVVDQAKPANERGFYLHPELYGQPAEKQTEWGRRPEQMRWLQAQRQAQQTRPGRRPTRQARSSVPPPALSIATSRHAPFQKRSRLPPSANPESTPRLRTPRSRVIPLSTGGALS